MAAGVLPLALLPLHHQEVGLGRREVEPEGGLLDQLQPRRLRLLQPPLREPPERPPERLALSQDAVAVRHGSASVDHPSARDYFLPRPPAPRRGGTACT